jgi:predicted nuclease of predicted toxin-antitoxin system
VKFLIDAQLPPLMAQVLRERGYDARHIFEIQRLANRDNEIWQFALDGDWVIVTKDEDFVERAVASRGAPRIVWIRWGNLRNRPLLDNVRRAWGAVADKLAAGEDLIEVQ